MRKIVLILFFLSFLVSSEKIFVVERSDSALAIIENHKLKNKIENLHNFNHAVVKFFENDGYAITRDGYVIKFDPVNERKLKEYKTSYSAIGFVIAKNFIAVANYDNKTVEILDRDLNPIQVFDTGSKNVGIKIYNDLLVFACMDSDELWVLQDINYGYKKPNFKVLKKIKNAGAVPFDAMITGDKYIVGFFNSPHFGVIDLQTLKYSKIHLNLGDRKPVLKVPHFGFWSISGDKIFVPAVGDRKVFAFSKDFKHIKTIATYGLPVFTSLSPDESKMCITFSGRDFPVIQILDTKSLKIIKTIKNPGKILHIRWSKEEPILYVSDNTNSKVLLYDTNSWNLIDEVSVRKPSGIFIFHNRKE